MIDPTYNTILGFLKGNSMDGLTVNRNIHYVASDGVCRAAFVTKVWDKESGVINLSYLNNGSEDVKAGIADPVLMRTSVTYSEEPKPNTWHWIERA